MLRYENIYIKIYNIFLEISWTQTIVSTIIWINKVLGQSTCDPILLPPSGIHFLYFEILQILHRSHAHVFTDPFPDSKTQTKRSSFPEHTLHLFVVLLGTSHILSREHNSFVYTLLLYRLCEGCGQEGLNWVTHTFSIGYVVPKRQSLNSSLE